VADIGIESTLAENIFSIVLKYLMRGISKIMGIENV